MKAAVIYATYGHWTQSLLNAGIPLAYHYQPKLDIDPNDERIGWVGDPLAKQILFMNFPNVEFRPPSANDEAYDLIVGSPPCVGFSRANPKACPDHPLNKHTFDFFKWVALNGPKYFLMEMVPGILKSEPHGFPDLHSTLPPEHKTGIFNQCLKLIGDDYRWDYEVMNASDYGAAQTRERLYVWGNRRDQEPMESPLASLPKRPSTPIQIVLSKEILDLAEQCPADGKSRLSLIGKSGKPIAGAWGSLRPGKRENRTLKMDGLMFTITGTSVRDCLIPIRTSLTNAKQNRLLTVLELKLLMGFPFSYSLPGKLHAGVKSKIIASGVDIRFASYLLQHIREELEYQGVWEK